ncbi:hypothetical protein [Deinococcus planocerae]|uniref:hypothetical protein n=1 Tax=Deinococcus planocerae TaxID=1737569 RepID=UPI0011AF9C60|nr:hypothetical protein [Deinococcus planocerae]
MDISRQNIVDSLKTTLTEQLSIALVDEFISLKRAFQLGQFSPTELSGGRFGEVLVRMFEYLMSGTYTPIGQQLKYTETTINRFENDGSQDEFFRFFAAKLCRVIMGVRNKRNVAHLAKNIDPNYQDALLITQSSTWILCELIRVYAKMDINDASMLIKSLSYQHVPIIENIEGFIKILDTSLGYRDKTLLILYSKYPQWVQDRDLQKWTGYSNSSRYKTDFLEPLSKEALTHREGSSSKLTSKGMIYVEKNIPLEFNWN